MHFSALIHSDGAGFPENAPVPEEKRGFCVKTPDGSFTLAEPFCL